MWALRSYLSTSFNATTLPPPRTLIFSAYRDKAISEMMQILFPLFDGLEDRILLVPMLGPRAASGEDLMSAAATQGSNVSLCKDVNEALRSAFARKSGSVIVTGSVHLIGDVYTCVGQAEVEGKG